MVLRLVVVLTIVRNNIIISLLVYNILYIYLKINIDHFGYVNYYRVMS